MLGIPATWRIAVFRIGLENLKILATAASDHSNLKSDLSGQANHVSPRARFSKASVIRPAHARIKPHRPGPARKTVCLSIRRTALAHQSGLASLSEDLEFAESRREPPGNSGGGRAGAGEDRPDSKTGEGSAGGHGGREAMVITRCGCRHNHPHVGCSPQPSHCFCNELLNICSLRLRTFIRSNFQGIDCIPSEWMVEIEIDE
jgi:hypothetical protein